MRASLSLCLLLSLGLIPRPGAAQTERGELLPDGTVRFVSGSTDLTRRSRGRVKRIASYLKARPDLKGIRVVGHTDRRGSEELNRKLAMGRAEIVRQALIKAGVAAERLRAVGLGSAEPVASGDTARARRLNRRVEVWAPPHPVAFVQRIQRKVEEKDPKSTWRAAKEEMPLKRLSQVRTRRGSSSEIRFPREDKVRLGPNALVIIYGSPQKTQARRQRVADIEVKGGSIFTELAAREGRTMAVATPSSQMSVSSKSTRIDASGDAATVSVFDGNTQVKSKGKRVKVKRGYGTRVKKGKPPEKPAPLPPPPRWVTQGPHVRYADTPLQLRWVPGRRTRKVEVRVESGPAGKQVLSGVWRLPKGEGTTAETLPPGLHTLRLVSVDRRGISGPAGPPLSVLVFSPLKDGEGKPLIPQRGELTMDRPGELVLTVPPGTEFELSEGAEEGKLRLPIAPGETVLSLAAKSGKETIRRQLRVRAPAPKVELTLADPVVELGRSTTAVQLKLTGPKGEPLSGLPLVAAPVSAITPALEVKGGSGQLLALHNEPPADGQALKDEGEGNYSYSFSAPADGRPRALRVYSEVGRMAADFEVPVGTVAPDPPAASGVFVGLRLGALLGQVDGPAPSFGGELGGRLPLSRAVDVTGAVELDWQRRSVDDDVVQVVPVLLRAELGWTADRPLRLFLGAGGGTLFAADEVRGVAKALGGASLDLGHHQLRLEVAYDWAGSLPRHTELDAGGLSMTLGYRLGTWNL